MKPSSSILRLLLPLALLGCASGDDPDVGSSNEHVYSDVGGLGPANGVEWQIDAPWRLEPNPDGSYDRIPLVLTFTDVADQIDDPGPDADIAPIHRFCGIYVLDRGEAPIGSPVTFIPPEQFHEIEGQRRWQSDGLPAGGPGDFHQLARIWADDSSEPVTMISDWSEWNATALYTPVATRAPGDDIELIVVARVSKGPACKLPNLEMTANDLLKQLTIDRASESELLGSYFFGDFLKVHYGEEALPRFPGGWVYGDLHYHSQGTDNEGENGVSYRGAIQAMKAMGLDFVFATEHASNGSQLTHVHRWGIDALPGDFWWIPDDIEDAIKEAIIDYLNAAGARAGSAEFASLRDMNHARFEHLHAWLNAPDGVNAEVGESDGSSRRPQIFLGGEIDAVPEMTVADGALSGFRYGSNRRYDVNEPCFGVPQAILDYTDFEEYCVGNLVDTASETTDRLVIHDIQGPFTIDKARQHLVYLPASSTDDKAFVSSDTHTYGGGHHRLVNLLENQVRGRGYVFLAHPIDAPSGQSPGRLGPDIVPYSDAQLETAFAAPEVLGLQLWNENSRRHTRKADRNFPHLHRQGRPEPEEPDLIQYPVDWTWAEFDETSLLVNLHQGGAMWDQVLRWGITPSRIHDMDWLIDPNDPNGPRKPRKMFMAGGSDAHGDLNYRRHGRMMGWESSSDTAIGTPRNLVFTGTSTPTQEQVIQGLKDGEFSVTDGPIVRIAVDMNGDGRIDPGDVPMGGDFEIRGATVPLLIEWKSTPEFGRVAGVDLYVGVQAADHEGMTYAPTIHGRIGGECIESATAIVDATGQERCPMKDGYVRDESGALRIDIDAADGYAATRQVNLDPNDYPLFDAMCESELVEINNDGEIETTVVTICTAENLQSPERLYVRALAETAGPVHRLGFSNPIWMTSRQVASPPTVTIGAGSCNAGTNTFAVDIEQGPVPGNLTSYYRVGSGSWIYYTGGNISAPGGTSVTVAAIACNANGCSPWVFKSRAGPTCNPPPPVQPGVKLEYTGCSYGVNSFVATVWPKGDIPVSSYTKQYRVGSGSWKTLSSSVIKAGSKQSVYLRARACNAYGCSSYAYTSIAGPYCSSGGGGGLPHVR